MLIFAHLGMKSQKGQLYRDKILLRVEVPDIITHANLGDDRFRGFRGSGAKFSCFPLISIDLRGRL